MAFSNPNGANQYQMDPRQKACWDFYIDPRSETFSNALQSAIKAGYEPDYADQITTVDWFKGKVRRLNLVEKAEKALEEVLDLDCKQDGKTIAALLGIRSDVAKFVAETQGKALGYTKRQELTGADGKSLPTPILASVIETKENVPSDNSGTKDIETQETHQDSPGRDISVEDNLNSPSTDQPSPV